MSVVERTIEKDQWYDPCVLMAGNGNEDWSRWATKWLYAGLVDGKDSKDWGSVGTITEFNRVMSFPAVKGLALPFGASVQSTISTNERNWLLLSRTVEVTTVDGLRVPTSLQNLVEVSISVPQRTLVMEPQPVVNTFGTGEFPHVLYLPEEWAKNVSRTVTVTNRTATIYNVTLSFKFLQVRAN